MPFDQVPFDQISSDGLSSTHCRGAEPRSSDCPQQGKTKTHNLSLHNHWRVVSVGVDPSRTDPKLEFLNLATVTIPRRLHLATRACGTTARLGSILNGPAHPSLWCFSSRGGK